MYFDFVTSVMEPILIGAAGLLALGLTHAPDVFNKRVVTTPTTPSAPAAMARLAPCPDTPNCVSTLAADEAHAIEPMAYTGTAAEAKQHLLAVVRALPRTRVEADEGDYLHVTFRSLVFRFVDDVEFVIDGAEQRVHFRAAARLGRWDLGVNRRRMEKIRRRFAQSYSENR